jgi:cell fate (sporulation/competence/biofilm development) regulator YmcA (YheA/YmcA/DUF963 family)
MNHQEVIDELRDRIARLEASSTRRRIYNQVQAAERLNMSVNKLRALHKQGVGPKRLSVHGRIWSYTDEALEEYIAAQAED